LSKHTVVIVEDDEDMRFLIVRTLRAEPRLEVVAQVSDARSAVDSISRTQPALVILDHYIHGRVMGLDSAPVIKAVAPEVKVIVFTESDFGFEAYLEPEVDAYLQKEDLPDLLPLIRKMLGLDQ
jgi:DNA-binding NarL/FixJ family response regulator